MRLVSLLLFCIGSLQAQVVNVTPGFEGGIQPQVCVAGDSIYVALGKDKTIYFAKSTNGGKSFGDPQTVATLDKLALGMRRGPRVAATKGILAISAISAATGNLLVWTSSDNGATWSKHAIINDVSGSAREGLHAMAANDDGKLFVTWLDLRNRGMELWGALSVDAGKTWKNSRVYSSPDGHICECCHPSAVFVRKDELVVMWRNWLGGARDMYFSTSRDGLIFGPATKFGTGSWSLNACPMDGGAIASNLKGEPISIWRRQNAVYLSTGPTSERELIVHGKQPVIAKGNGKMFYLWLEGNRLMIQTEPGSGKPQLLAENANFPSIASLGPDSPLILVWESCVNDSKTILSQILR